MNEKTWGWEVNVKMSVRGTKNALFMYDEEFTEIHRDVIQFVEDNMKPGNEIFIKWRRP